jgi:hypothetical protein
LRSVLWLLVSPPPASPELPVASASPPRQKPACPAALHCAINAAVQEGLATAQRHVSIASLYLGTGGGREAEFAAALAAAAHDATRPHLQIHVLLDALRSTRPTSSAAAPAATAAASSGSPSAEGSSSSSGSSSLGSHSSSGSGSAGMTSTAEMLAVSLLEGQQQYLLADADGEAQGATRVAVSLFHTPALQGLLKRCVCAAVRWACCCQLLWQAPGALHPAAAAEC